ncbi:MAG: hypothetical protein J5599_00840 [Spirochaetales bacterium]|nr:hypothetical protein [Spirochaetales bacterium]
MRKIIYICIVAIALLCVTACSQDFYAGLGSAMGGMSGNIYGIKSDVRKAQASAALVSESIVRNADGSVTIDLAKAASITDNIADIKKSQQRSEALRTYLSEEIPEEDAQAVSEALIAQMDELYVKLENYQVSDSMVDVRQSLLGAISDIEGSLYYVDSFTNTTSTRKPVMADIAVAALIDKMAASMMNGTVDVNAVSDLGRASVDTIKVIAGISTLDVLADINLTGLVSSKGISRDDDGGVSPVLGSLLGKTAKKIVDLITTDRKFDPNKYSKFIMESKALKAAYEMTCVKYMPEEKTIINFMIAAAEPDFVVDSDLTIEDFFMYLILSLNIALEDYTGGIWGMIINDYVQEGNNYAILSDLDNATEAPSSLGGSVMRVIQGIVKTLQDKYQEAVSMSEDFDFDALMEDIEAKKEANPKYGFEDEMDDYIHAFSGDPEFGYSEMMESLGNSLREAQENLSEFGRRFTRGINNVITTSFVMLFDSEYDILLQLLSSMVASMFPET